VVGIVQNIAVDGNSVGIQATGAHGEFIVGDSVITANTTVLSVVSGGVIFAYGNNEINGDGSSASEVFSSPLIPLK
jgi:hypothetical protein